MLVGGDICSEADKGSLPLERHDRISLVAGSQRLFSPKYSAGYLRTASTTCCLRRAVDFNEIPHARHTPFVCEFFPNLLDPFA